MQFCTVEALKSALDQKAEAHFVDVRMPAEFQKGHIDGFTNIPLGSDPLRWEKFDKKLPVYLICLSGARSQSACADLQVLGFENLISVQGGMLTWRTKGFPVTSGL